MLAGTDFQPSDELGLMGPKWGVATVESLAINAVMAGLQARVTPGRDRRDPGDARGEVQPLRRAGDDASRAHRW